MEYVTKLLLGVSDETVSSQDDTSTRHHTVREVSFSRSKVVNRSSHYLFHYTCLLRSAFTSCAGPVSKLKLKTGFPQNQPKFKLRFSCTF